MPSSHQMNFGRIFVSFVVLVSLTFTSPATAGGGGKVSLALYYESLCPYSANFIVNYLSNIFDNGLIDIVNLDLIPYGNARVRANGTITCQHGPYECLLNTIETCAINVWPDLNEHFKFIYCIESLELKHKYQEWQSCFEKTGLNSEAVCDCFYSGYGKELEIKYAAKTDSLQPPHKYVPWVVVNGQPLYEDYENFEAYICKAYKGDPPKACKGLTVIMTKEKEKARAHCVRFVHNEVFGPVAVTAEA